MRASLALRLMLLGGFVLGLVYGGMRVYALERGEIEYESPPRPLRELTRVPGSTRISARLASAELGANQRVIFELCARDGLTVETFRDAFDLAVIHQQAKKLMLRVALDQAHLEKARRSSQGGCLLIGSGLLEQAGTYSVEAIYPSTGLRLTALDVPLSVRILARTELTASDRNVVLVLGAALLALLALQLQASAKTRPRPDDPVGSFTGAGVITVPALALLSSALVFAVSELPLVGPTRTLAKGVGLLLLQVGLAFALSRDHEPPFARGDQLALRRPGRPALALTGALVSWPVLVSASMIALRIVPSTGEAPIQTFISWPSGMLATALLGLLLPVGEELYFRGYLYGALLGYGRAWSASVNVVVFGSLHLVQSWGNWGGLVGVFAAGLVFLTLRIMTGSVLIAAIVHVAYNWTLSLASLRAVGITDGG